MIVGLFCDTTFPENLAAHYRELIESFGVDCETYRIDDRWLEGVSDELSGVWGQLSHIVVLRDCGRVAGWEYLLFGYVVGRSLAVAVVLQRRQKTPTVWNARSVFDTDEQLRNWLKLEQFLFERDQAIEQSRAELEAAGYSINESAYFEAVRRGDLPAVIDFFHLGFTADAVDLHGIPVLNCAVRSRSNSVALFLLERGADPNGIATDRGTNALSEACSAGEHELMSRLLDAGADPDSANIDGQTALMIAVGNNDVEACRLLMNCGARADIADRLGMTARTYAKLFGRGEIEQLLTPAERR